MSKKLISIVTPCFNEEQNVLTHYDRVCKALEPFRDRYEFEHIYTDNCSSDQTFSILTELSRKHSNVRVLRFSRNIGSGRAIYFGLMNARGIAAMLIQADLQDPPELIPDFIRRWEEGYDVIYGQILSRQEGFITQLLRKLYYKVIAKLSDVPPPENAGEFRFVTRRVLDAMAQYHEDDIYLRGIISHIGYRQCALPYHRMARTAGTSSSRLPYLFDFALNGLISTTVAPIRAVILMGLLIAVLGFAFSFYIVALKLLMPEMVPAGATTILAVMTFFAGVQLLALGIIGEYIRKIYVQSLRRPQGFIQDKVNFPATAGPENSKRYEQ